jgi:hypothetical protein
VVNLTGIVLPPWARWAALAVIVTAAWGLGNLQGERRAGEKHTEYVMKQATETTRIAQAQVKVVTKTETVYRDRIQKIYVQGEKSVQIIHDLVVPTDDAMYGVNVGWVRAYNAAWAGDLDGPAAESDRGPAGIPISAIAETETHNATSCRAWREQALGWRAFYFGQQQAINK